MDGETESEPEYRYRATGGLGPALAPSQKASVSEFSTELEEINGSRWTFSHWPVRGLHSSSRGAGFGQERS